MLRQRRGGQAIVEFGLVALIFVLILFGIVDFGLLLNDWVSVSSGARELGRSATVGVHEDELVSQAQGLSIPGVAADNPPFTGGYCCTGNTALQLTVQYFDGTGHCVGGAGVCPLLNDPNNAARLATLDDRVGTPHGTCHVNAGGPLCPHPAGGDTMQLTLRAAGAQVITPLVRLVFGCDGTAVHCYVPLSTTVTMRVEGPLLP